MRELVAFSYFPPDITPAEDAERMLAGGRAHRARQAGAAGESEKSLCHAFSCLGADVTVYGRMDLFEDGDVPFVEEIKLGAQARPEPLPEHWAQAVCYGAMLAKEKPCERVRLCVCYVDEAGEALSRHEETLDRDALATALQNLLEPWTACALRESAYRRERDASLQALAFPYESYRKGQRELAVQVYTAIRRKKRLFASLPTGTGKSAAVLYPALKALGEGLTGKVLYLTAPKHCAPEPRPRAGTYVSGRPARPLHRAHSQGKALPGARSLSSGLLSPRKGPLSASRRCGGRAAGLPGRGVDR